MNKMLLVSEVAGLAKDIERSHISMKVTMPVPSECFGRSRESCVAHERQDASIDDDTDGDTTNSPRSKRSAATSERVIDTTARDPLTGSLHQSERIKIMQLLEQWEEPSRRFHQSHVCTPSIAPHVALNSRVYSDSVRSCIRAEWHRVHFRGSAIPKSADLHSKALPVLVCFRTGLLANSLYRLGADSLH